MDPSRRFDRSLQILRIFLRLVGQDIFEENSRYNIVSIATFLSYLSYAAAYIYTIWKYDDIQTIITAISLFVGIVQVSGFDN